MTKYRSGNNSQHTPRSNTQRNQNAIDDASPNEVLFRTIMGDRSKRALILQLLSMDKTSSSPLQTSAQPNSEIQESSRSGLLKNVTAYVDLRSREGFDRSSGVKTLMRSLGATVQDNFTDDITHLVFKDGSFDVYLKAKQKQVFIVSVLWLEAVRNANSHVPEKDYPALGTSAYDVNVTEMCKDYEDMLQEERHFASTQHSNNYGFSIHNQTGLSGDVTFTNLSDTLSTPDNLPVMAGVPTQVGGLQSCGLLAPTNSLEEPESDRLISTPELTSDDDSDCGIINGEAAKQPKAFQNLSELNKEQQLVQDSSSNSFSLLAASLKEQSVSAIIDLTDLEDKENTPKTNANEDKSKKLTKGIKKTSKYKTPIKTKSLSPIMKSKKKQQKKLKASSDSLIRNNNQYMITRSNQSTSHENLSNSSNARTPQQKNQQDSDILPGAKKRAKIKPNSKDGKKHKPSPEKEGTSSPTVLLENATPKSSLDNPQGAKKRSSWSQSMQSLRISEENSGPNIISVVTVNDMTKTISDTSLINRLSRMAIRGSGDTTNSSNSAIISSMRNTSKNSFQSTSSSSIKAIQKNITKIINSTDGSIDLTNNSSESSDGTTDLTNHSKQSSLDKSKNISSSENDSCSENSSPSSEKFKPPTRKKQPRVIRRLYNPDQSITDMHKMWVEEENRKAHNIPNKQLVVQLVPVAPILFTPKAKKFLKFLNKNNPGVSKKNTTMNETLKVKDKKKTKKKASKKAPVKRVAENDENDEQVELISEILNARRQSLRILQQPTSVNRRSTLDFQNTPRRNVCYIFTQNRRRIKPSIVCTRFHKPDVLLFYQIVKKLGTFFVEDEVSQKTTHLVVGECRRTINILRALARGCWILSQEWLLRSLEAGEWLEEEEFELTEFSPAVQKCRLQRLAFGRTFSIDVFVNCGPIYIARSSNPRRSDLEELVILCKGRICNSINNASIVVGEWVRRDVVCVSEQWILDSITWNTKKSFRKYLLE